MPDPAFVTDPMRRQMARVREQLAAIRDRLFVARSRRALMRRLFGDPANPSRDARRFFLLLADEAGMGAIDIADTDREETARAAKRALVNSLIDTWEGGGETLMRLRARERELTEENEHE